MPGAGRLGGSPRKGRDLPSSSLAERSARSVRIEYEVTRGMREAASRGFWMTTSAPYGYQRVYVQDGIKKRPRLEPNPPRDAVIRRIFARTLQGRTSLDILKTLNSEGIANPTGRLWAKNGVHIILRNEAYTGTLVCGEGAKDKGEPVRVEKAFPAIVSKTHFRKVNRQMRSRAPRKVHPRRAVRPLPAAAWPSARPATRPSPPPRPRAASTPTTSASP